MKTEKKWFRFSNITTLGRIRLLGILIAIAAICSFFCMLLLNSKLVRDWEDRFQTKYYLLKSNFSEPKAGDLPLVLVLIDDHSLPENTARSPIDRDWLADLIQSIDEQQPDLIALNVLLDRPGNNQADKKLQSVLKKTGKVVIRDDPFYPVYPPFQDAVLDKGTIKFRLDSSDTVQEVCANEIGCRSADIFYQKILDYYRFANGISIENHRLDSPWIKINFAVSEMNGEDWQMLSFPTLKAHEVEKLPPLALKDKIVLIGTGFPDLYPLYRVPLTDPGTLFQETELIAQVLNMVATNNYLVSASSIWVGVALLLLLALIAFVVVYFGVIVGLLTSLFSIIAIFCINAFAFAFYNIEIAFVLPTTMIVIYNLVAILISAVHERFTRLNTELSLKQAKIDFLTNELHSHHLFNEFSRLSVMIQHDPKSAKDYLVEFAEMLRSSLKFGDKKMVPVNVQVEYLESYLNQQRLIHQDKMSFNFVKVSDVESLLAPWHTFFPLVENSVKYSEGYLNLGLADSAEIEISLDVSPSHLLFSVKNPYAPNVAVASSKTGLKNLEQRLEWAYPAGDYTLDFKHDEQTWIAELRLPIQKGTR